jgi:mannobiose 2-epimerase
VTPAKQQTAEEILSDVLPRLNGLAARAFAFWAQHGPDRKYGGVHATLDRQGTPVEPTDKGVIQQARQLWTASMWYARREPSAAVKQLADDTYAFLIKHYLDGSDGEFRFKVSESGKVVDGKKQLYAESFAIYALATYGQTFDVPAAKEQALACFRSLDRRAHDAQYGGYDQRRDPGWLAKGAEKGTNTQIHLLEAFTTLWEATHDAEVGERLDEMIEVTATKLFQDDGYVHKEFLADFTPHAERVVSYGHDLETVWLLLEAARVRGKSEDQRVRKAAIAMGQHASQRGFDPVAGGFFYEGVPGAEATNRAKVWWVQFEALSGLFWLWELTGDRVHLERLERTVSWLETAHDDEYGEWFEETLDDGSAGPPGTKKGHEWKTGYHGLRALVFTADWIHKTLEVD